MQASIQQVMRGLAVLADDDIEEALEKDPSPEKAKLLMESHLNYDAVLKVAAFVEMHLSKGFDFEAYIEGLEEE